LKILLVVYDNDSYISYFPTGLAYIASVCREAGHDVSIYHQDVYHWPDSHLRDVLDKEQFDVVGIGACAGYYTYRKVLKIAEVINSSRFRPFFMLGGHLSAPEPEYFLKKTKADVVIIGEGETTVLEILSVLEAKESLDKVQGIAFMDDGEYVQTSRRPLIKEIDKIPFPAWDLFPMDHYSLMRLPNVERRDRCMSVLSGRGCTFRCNFCYRMDEGFRGRSAESIIEEIQILQRNYAITYVDFVDELLMSSVQRTIDLCQSFINAKLNIRWCCNGRLNYAKPDVLRLMRQAGCVFINYGIESMDDQTLRVMNKALTTKQVITGIENTLNTGISPGFNIIFGNIGETAESLAKGVDFLLKYDDHSQLRTIKPVTPYPGCDLYYYAIEKGLMQGAEDFYENKHTNSDLLSVNFTDISDEEFHKLLFQANSRLLINYFKHQESVNLDIARKLYLGNDTSFRGFRQS